MLFFGVYVVLCNARENTPAMYQITEFLHSMFTARRTYVNLWHCLVSGDSVHESNDCKSALLEDIFFLLHFMDTFFIFFCVLNLYLQ